MALTVTHPFVCAIADNAAAAAAGEVVPSNWNADHTIDLVSLLDGDGSQVLVTKNTNVDNADNANFRIAAYAHDVNPISGRFNEVYRIGYNVSQNGTGYDTSEPSFGFSWESFYEAGGAEYCEFHITYFNAADTEFRWDSWQHNRATDKVGRTSRFTYWVWEDETGTDAVNWQWESASSITAFFGDTISARLNFGKNNYATLRQSNAAGDADLDYPYFNNEDRFKLNYNFAIIGTAPTTGTYANYFGHIQATTGVANGRLLNLSCPTITGDYDAVYVSGNASDALTFYIYNGNNTSSSAKARLLLLARETHGDPQITFVINGATTVSTGIDNSDSDKYKVSFNNDVGSNTALAIDTSLNSRFYGNLGIANATNGQACEIKTLTELLTIAAAATSTTTIQKPANSIILAVPVRVTTAVTCTSTFTVGDAGSATRFSTAAVSKAVNSTDKGTKAGAYYNATAEGIVITPDTVPSDATGRVRVTIYYIECTPPTS